ncbi:MAG: putative glycosyltransferase YkoT [Desulfovibrio sp.]
MQNTPSHTPPVLTIIFPCYNEEEVLPTTLDAVGDLLRQMVESGQISQESFILCVDDGSIDATWKLITEYHKKDPRIQGMRFAGNAGHQNALLAGMHAVAPRVDCAITIDADLQDDIAVIPQMVEEFTKGSHVVYGVRKDRTADTWFKRTTANLFYSGMSLLGAPIIPGHADFRLVSKFAMQSLEAYPESNLFLRSIFPSMKLRSSSVYYARKARKAGETKYPFWKMVSFAVRGVTVCSPAPLRLAGLLSIVTLVFAVLQSFAALGAYFTGNAVPGWTSLTLVLLYLGSVQLFCLAILGEYIAKIFTEVKRRPRYMVEEELR